MAGTNDKDAFRGPLFEQECHVHPTTTLKGSQVTTRTYTANDETITASFARTTITELASLRQKITVTDESLVTVTDGSNIIVETATATQTIHVAGVLFVSVLDRYLRNATSFPKQNAKLSI